MTRNQKINKIFIPLLFIVPAMLALIFWWFFIYSDTEPNVEQSLTDEEIRTELRCDRLTEELLVTDIYCDDLDRYRQDLRENNLIKDFDDPRARDYFGTDINQGNKGVETNILKFISFNTSQDENNLYYRGTIEEAAPGACNVSLSQENGFEIRSDNSYTSDSPNKDTCVGKFKKSDLLEGNWILDAVFLSNDGLSSATIDSRSITID